MRKKKRKKRTFLHKRLQFQEKKKKEGKALSFLESREGEGKGGWKRGKERSRLFSFLVGRGSLSPLTGGEKLSRKVVFPDSGERKEARDRRGGRAKERESLLLREKTRPAKKKGGGTVTYFSLWKSFSSRERKGTSKKKMAYSQGNKTASPLREKGGRKAKASATREKEI